MRDVAYATWSRIGAGRITLDVDGTVVRMGELVEGAERGFHPHHPKDPSYDPLTAQLAQTGPLLGVWNRSGNNHDSAGAAEHLALHGRPRGGTFRWSVHPVRPRQWSG